MELKFKLFSNITEISGFATLKAAKAEAIAESLRFDDTVTIHTNGWPTHAAIGGSLFRLEPTK